MRRGKVYCHSGNICSITYRLTSVSGTCAAIQSTWRSVINAEISALRFQAALMQHKRPSPLRSAAFLS